MAARPHRIVFGVVVVLACALSGVIGGWVAALVIGMILPLANVVPASGPVLWLANAAFVVVFSYGVAIGVRYGVPGTSTRAVWFAGVVAGSVLVVVLAAPRLVMDPLVDAIAPIAPMLAARVIADPVAGYLFAFATTALLGAGAGLLAAWAAGRRLTG